MEAKKSHDLLSVGWRLRRVSGTNSKAWEPGKPVTYVSLESEGLETRRTNVQGQKKMDVQLK